MGKSFSIHVCKIQNLKVGLVPILLIQEKSITNFAIQSELIYLNSEQWESSLSDTKLLGTDFSQCIAPL